jgi:serpin B
MYRMRWLGRCALVVGLVAVAACGSDDSTADQAPARSDGPAVESRESADPVPSSDAGDPLDVDIVVVAERSAPVASRTVAGQAITEFGLDLFGEVRSATPAENIAMSPASVAIALAMVEPGAVDLARDQIRAILRIDDPAAFHASMNALEQDLETRTPGSFGEGSDPGQVTVNVANAAFLQRGYPFQQAYLDAVGSNYGPVLREVDFAPDPDRVAHEINDFVADATNDQIVDLIADGTIRPETVLALVNALYLKASWLAPFNEAATADPSLST